MKHKNTKIHLRREDIEFMGEDASPLVCAICPSSKHLIRVKTLNTQLDLCPKHLAQLFKTPSNRFPKGWNAEKGVIVRKPTSPEFEVDEQGNRHFFLKVTGGATKEFWGRRIAYAAFGDCLPNDRTIQYYLSAYACRPDPGVSPGVVLSLSVVDRTARIDWHGVVTAHGTFTAAMCGLADMFVEDWAAYLGVGPGVLRAPLISEITNFVHRMQTVGR